MNEKTDDCIKLWLNLLTTLELEGRWEVYNVHVLDWVV